jgi:elongation factor G
MEHGLMRYRTQDIRNLALAGHPGSGKTTLFEALLHAGGTLQVPGSIERGNTVSDHDPLERNRGHSIDSAIAAIDRDGLHLNLIDTPGYPEFRGAALSALAVVETALIVVDAARGIEHGTRRLLQRAGERRLCRAIVVNKIDQDGVDCATLLEQLRREFGRTATWARSPTGTSASSTRWWRSTPPRWSAISSAARPACAPRNCMRRSSSACARGT